MSGPHIEDPAQAISEHRERNCNMSENLAILAGGSSKGDRKSSASAELAHQRNFYYTRSAAMSYRSAHAQRSPNLHDQEAMRGWGVAVQAVFNTPELLIMILWYLSTRDLTRCLAVSKHWRDMILDPKSKKLRRILFLEPAKARDHLEYKTNTEPRFYYDKYKSWYKPTIVHEPNQNSRPIVEVHPILLPGSDLDCKTFLRTGPTRHRSIRSILPSTYLFQPPVEEIEIICRSRECNYLHSCKSQLRCTGGVTFGALLAELDKQRKRADVYIEAREVLFIAAQVVKTAWMAHVLKELYEHNTLQVQKGLPEVPEAEFEQLRELGSRQGWEAAPSFLESGWYSAG